MNSVVYGYCPICGAPGVERERRPNGNDKCSKGHVYPSRSAKHRPTTVVELIDENDEDVLNANCVLDKMIDKKLKKGKDTTDLNLLRRVVNQLIVKTHEQDKELKRLRPIAAGVKTLLESLGRGEE